MEGKRNHHRPLYQVWVCGALAYATRNANVAHAWAGLAKVGYNDSKVFVKTVYRDTWRKEETK